MLLEQIKTIENFTSHILKEKGSEFIAEVYPAAEEKIAQEYLQSTRKKYFDATHHCYAYQLNPGLSKYSDDGEPKGTAGIRILNAINHFDLTNLMLVVTRYFGGTKLGVGPLGKAYYNSAISVLEKSNLVTLELYQKVEILSAFDYLNQIHHLFADNKVKIIHSDFTDKVRFDCLAKSSIIDKIKSELTNISGGQISVTISDHFTYEKFT